MYKIKIKKNDKCIKNLKKLKNIIIINIADSHTRVDLYNNNNNNNKH